MLDRQLVKRLDRQGCLEYLEGYQRELDLANRRLERLRNKQKQNPNFEAFDYYVRGNVSIAIRIEEWESVKDELEWYLQLLDDQLIALKMQEEHPSSKRMGDRAFQLSFTGPEDYRKGDLKKLL